MIFETNEQALFLVPMAISLGVGTLASAMVVLILIPVVLVVMEEAQSIAVGQRETEPIHPPELAGQV